MNFYFKWLHGTRSKPEIIPTLIEYGWHGYGLYAVVMEVLSEHGGTCKRSVLQYTLNLHKEDWYIIQTCGAFRVNDDSVSNMELMQASAERRKVSKERSKSGRKGMKNRWSEKPQLFDNHIQDGVTNASADGITNGITKDNNIIVTVIDKATNTEEQLSLSNSPTVRKKLTVEKTVANASDKSLKGLTVTIEKIYYEWMEERNTPAKFSVAGRKAAKSIGSYLHAACKKKQPDFNDEQRCAQISEAWKFILFKVQAWGKYESTKLRLIDIDSNLTNILNNIKNGNTTSKGNGTPIGKTASTVQSIDRIKDF